MGWSAFAKIFGQTAKVKLEQGVQAATTALAGMDPEAVSEAQIRIMDDKLNALREKLVRAQQALDQDLKETATWQQKAEEIRKALLILKGQAEAAGDEAAREGILDKARRLAAQLQNAQAEVAREQGEDAEKKAILDQIQAIYDQVRQKRDGMQAQLGEARNRMAQAQLREEAAKLREQEQKELAGLVGGFDEMGIALDAMNKAAEEAGVRASMANMAADEMAAKGDSGAEDLLQEILGTEAKKAKEVSDPFAGL